MSKVITPQDEYDKSKIFEDEIRPLLEPTTKFAQFNEESLGAEAMDYINNTPLEDEDESKMTASVGEGMSFGNKFEQVLKRL